VGWAQETFVDELGQAAAQGDAANLQTIAENALGWQSVTRAKLSARDLASELPGHLQVKRFCAVPSDRAQQRRCHAVAIIENMTRQVNLN
jgi:hypothetical protein